MISSFYGLQTSLRGLLAQQRMLDTTGHNIANASTKGYSRQEATLVASPALIVPAGSLASGAGAHIGSGVDVETFRRVRNQFVDLQYRSQNTNLGEWAARANALDAAELSLAEPGENGINEQLARFWDAWADVANAPVDPAAKQALAEQAGALADAFATVRAQIAMARDQGMAEYATLSGPTGEVALAAQDLAGLNDQIKRYITAGDIPNDLLDRRDLLIDQLSRFGQVSVTEQADGTVDVAFVDTAAAATTYPIVTGTTATWAGPPAGDAWSPGGRLGGLLEASRSGGTLDGYLADVDAVATSLATLVNGAYGATFFETGPGPAGATLRVEAGIAADPRAIDPGSGNAGSNDRALAVGALRDHASIDRAYQAFVAKVGAQVRDARRQEANAQVLTDAVENRRQSVSGVSLDEEMANMVRFQRSYQASARAMSTMDEMLDVLINRTGRVGL
ncbi:MAG TPA: flagellar hook-associated protein FlgK [Solirubrobacteraceae bacterium]|jgi:flagellar hook-associated protein 1|nr:flagellar hook-associated protein FlgK [Solirubrobacteraceae bacterium]